MYEARSKVDLWTYASVAAGAVTTVTSPLAREIGLQSTRKGTFASGCHFGRGGALPLRGTREKTSIYGMKM